MDLEPYQVHNNEETSSKSKSICEDQLENAVIKQELMAAKEEMADLKAKIYVSDKEKRGKNTRRHTIKIQTVFRFNRIFFFLFPRIGFDFTGEKIGWNHVTNAYSPLTRTSEQF